MKMIVIIIVFVLTIIGSVQNALCFQSETVDLKLLKQLFVNEFGKDFQFVKGELKNNTIESEQRQYWLAHVKPKQTGFFTIKYSYQYADKFYSYGETEMKIAVGGKNGSRYPQVVRERGYFCLGDTIVIPIRLTRFSKHTFTLESKYIKAEEIEQSRETYNHYKTQLTPDKVPNPVEENLKYLGKHRQDQLFRSGGGNFTYLAIFEAKKIGKFNIILSGETNKGRISLRSEPVIIIERGTPITSLVPEETSTFYIKDQRYSSAYQQNYESNLMILHPGDVVAVPFLFLHAKSWLDKKSSLTEGDIRSLNPTPTIQKQPFSIKTEDGFNKWVNDLLTN